MQGVDFHGFPNTEVTIEYINKVKKGKISLSKYSEKTKASVALKVN